jgi:hypothetical protein
MEKRTGKEIDGSKEWWKPDITAIRAVIQFVKATGRFQSQSAPRVDEEDEERGDEERGRWRWSKGVGGGSNT